MAFNHKNVNVVKLCFTLQLNRIVTIDDFEMRHQNKMQLHNKTLRFAVFLCIVLRKYSVASSNNQNWLLFKFLCVCVCMCAILQYFSISFVWFCMRLLLLNYCYYIQFFLPFRAFNTFFPQLLLPCLANSTNTVNYFVLLIVKKSNGFCQLKMNNMLKITNVSSPNDKKNKNILLFYKSLVSSLH